MEKYQEALNKLIDWFHSYVDEKGVTVHERHITPEYKEAEKNIRELITAFILLKNKLELNVKFQINGLTLEYYAHPNSITSKYRAVRHLDKEEYELLQKVFNEV